MLGCSVADWATAAVTVFAGIGAACVVVIHAIRRDPPYPSTDG